MKAKPKSAPNMKYYTTFLDEIDRPRNAFTLFKDDKIMELAKAGVGGIDALVLVGKLWKITTSKTKLEYEDLAKADIVRYHMDVKTFYENQAAKHEEMKNRINQRRLEESQHMSKKFKSANKRSRSKSKSHRYFPFPHNRDPE